MKEFNKRLVEVEYILNKLDMQYICKIPQEIWDFIKENKDINYEFKYNESKTMLENNLHLDTISILTYININFLLDYDQKKEMIELLRKDEIIADQEKKKIYNPDNLFDKEKNNRTIKRDINTLTIKSEKKSVVKELVKRIKEIFSIKNK